MEHPTRGVLLGAQPLDTSVPVDDDLDLTSPQFAVRLGSLLAATRRQDGRTVRDVASVTGGQFGPGRLRRIERGSVLLDDWEIDAVCRVYGADLGAILPSRVAVTIEDHVMVVGGLDVRFERDDPTSVLSAYLALVRSMRDQTKVPAVAVRRDDVVRLAEYLNLDGPQVIERLGSLMGATAAQRIALGSLFAAGAVVICLVAAGQAFAEVEAVPAPPAARSASGHVVDTSDATVDTTPIISIAATGHTVSTTAPRPAVADRTQFDDAANSLPAPTLTAPPTVAPVPTPAPVDVAVAATSAPIDVAVAATPAPIASEPTMDGNSSGCNTDPGGAVMSLTMPDISSACPVYAGGESMLDAGFVTLVTDAGPNAVLATRPGDPGTLWLAGHRTTHGGAFADVPDLSDGALITVADGEVLATYRVVARSHVEVRDNRVVDADGIATAQATWESIIRSDMSGNLAPRLVLQTCDGDDFRWMIYADLVTG